MVLAGHSMGGWITAETAATDHALAGAIMISAWDPGAAPATDAAARAKLTAAMSENYETLAGTSPAAMADELVAHGAAWSFPPLAPGLAHLPLLVLTSDDGNERERHGARYSNTEIGWPRSDRGPCRHGP